MNFPIITVFTLLVFIVTGCPANNDSTGRDFNNQLIQDLKSSSDEKEIRNKLLDKMISSPNSQSFNSLLKMHGSIRADEFPTLAKAAKSWNSRKRYNAVRLLTLGPKEVGPVLRQLVSETTDVRVWALSLQTLFADKDPQAPLLAQSRPEMLKKAIGHDDPIVINISLRARVLGQDPTIKEQLAKNMAHPNWRVRKTAIEVIGDAQLKEFDPQLRDLLIKEKDPGVVREILGSLFKSGESKNKDAVLLWLKNADRYQENTFFNSIPGNPSNWVRGFLFEQARNPDLKYHRSALNKLSSWVYAQGKEPDIEFVRLCVSLYEKHWPLPAPGPKRLFSLEELGPCQRMLSHMAQRKIKGEDTLSFAKDWLEKNGSRKASK